MQTFGITLFESEEFGGVKLAPPKCIPTLKANKVCAGVVEVEKIGKLLEPVCLGGIGNKWGDKQYRQGNRVYSSNTVAMCLTSQPIGNLGGNSYLYLVAERLNMNEVKVLGQMDNTIDHTFESANRVYDVGGYLLQSILVEVVDCN